MEKQRLVEVVEDVNNDVIVTGGVDVGSRKFIVDENNLLRNTSRGECAISYIPCEIEIRIFTLNH
jgi:hypothetical protein